MTFSEKLKFYRGVLGISQLELSKRSGLTQAAICQYESGKRTPDLRSFMQITKSIGVSYSKMFDDLEI